VDTIFRNSFAYLRNLKIERKKLVVIQANVFYIVAEMQLLAAVIEHTEVSRNTAIELPPPK
jgi:hypothetical protein